MTLGRQIKNKREEKSWTQQELAEKLYVSRQTISNWEVGRSYPDIESLIRLSELFSLSLDELIKGDVKMVDSLKKKKIWNVLFEGAIFSLILASCICLLIDFLLNHYFSWSLIVSFSCLIAGAGSLIFYKTEKEKLVKSALGISILLFPFLVLIHHFYNYGVDLIPSLAIMGTWIVFAWVIITLWRFTRLSIFEIIGISCLVSIINIFMGNLFLGSGIFNFELTDWVTSLVNIIIGVLFLLVARSKSVSQVNKYFDDLRFLIK